MKWNQMEIQLDCQANNNEFWYHIFINFLKILFKKKI